MQRLTLAVTAVQEPGFIVHLEPEGMTYEVTPDSGVRLQFGPSPSGEAVEVSWVPGGLVVGRPADADASVTTDRGEPLDW